MIKTFLFPADEPDEVPPTNGTEPLVVLAEFFFEDCLFVVPLFVLFWGREVEELDKASADPPPVVFVPVLAVVVPAAARDDGVNEPAMEAFGVMLGPPPEVVDGDAWDPGDDESILAWMAETWQKAKKTFFP